MFSPANEPQFTLTLAGADFQVLSFKGTETLNTPFAFELELVSERAFLDLEKLLHQQTFLQLSSSGTGIHGLVYSIAQGEAGRRLTRYSLSLRPQLAYLEHRINQRIFQQMAVRQIIAEVLEEHGILASDYQFQLGATYPERVYCVQYDESDLHFIRRLCEEEGIHFHFQHSPEGHMLVFGDDQTVFPKLAPVAYQQDAGLVADTPMIKRFGLRLSTRTSRVTRRDYDFTKPRIELESDAKSKVFPDLEDYDYPGRFVDRERGKHLATRNLERHRSDSRLAEGKSDQPRLVSGHFLPLTEHANAGWNDLWLLTEVVHEGRQPQVLEESIISDVTDLKDDFHQGYRNTFSAIAWDVPYRPPLKHPKPKVLGSQSAIVDVRALKDSINLLAKLNITANADRITLNAKTELVIQGGGSATTYNAGGITHVTTGPYTAHAANFAYTGAKSLAGVFPEPPNPGKGNLELFNQYAGRQGIKGGDFEVIDALGKRLKGALDTNGFAAVAGAAPGPARVKFGPDPADTWSDGSYIGKPEWPREQPGADSDSLPGPIQSLIADVLPSAGKSAELLETSKGMAKSGMDVAKSGMAAAQTGMGVIQDAQAAMQSVQQVKTAVQAGAAGLPQLAGAVVPGASSALSLASQAARLPNLPTLPSLPTFTPPQNPFKTPDVLAGETLS